jgi:DNA repair exonuclease SbcCD ATPase subunit
MHKDTRDELENQKEKIDANIAKINADEEELSAKRREAQKKCNDEKNRLKKALKSAEAEVESKGPEGYAAQLLEIKAVKDEEIQLNVEREKEKNKFSKEASDLKNKRAAAEKKAKKKDKEIEKLSGKYEKYENETKASAIMTTLSMTFISLCQWLLSTYFKWDKIGLETLIEKIFRLPGKYVDSNTERVIYLDCQNKNRNKHEQEFNRMMERACMELSRSNIKFKDGRLLRVKYLTPS